LKIKRKIKKIKLSVNDMNLSEAKYANYYKSIDMEKVSEIVCNFMKD